jgi:cold shock CspA family protein
VTQKIQGEIESFLPQRNYGFIIGNDGVQYFFHKNDFVKAPGSIVAGHPVSFVPGLGRRGFRAGSIDLVHINDSDLLYIVPDSFLQFKDRDTKKWEILNSADGYIAVKDDDLDTARNNLCELAKSLHANALINVTYKRSTGCDYNYRYSVHNFSGIPVQLARRSSRGTVKKNDFKDINAAYQEWVKQEKERKNNEADGFEIFVYCLAGGAVVLVLSGIIYAVLSGLGIITR